MAILGHSFVCISHSLHISLTSSKYCRNVDEALSQVGARLCFRAGSVGFVVIVRSLPCLGSNWYGSWLLKLGIEKPGGGRSDRGEFS